MDSLFEKLLMFLSLRKSELSSRRELLNETSGNEKEDESIDRALLLNLLDFVKLNLLMMDGSLGRAILSDLTSVTNVKGQ
jgi:hypothetical protein